jgi:hypothetical protein
MRRNKERNKEMTKEYVRRAVMSATILGAQAFSGIGVLTGTFAQTPPNLSTHEGSRAAIAYEQTAAQTKEEALAVSGKWQFVFETGGGDKREETATFQQDGTKVTGKFANADVQGAFRDGELDLSFPFTSEGGRMSGTLKIKGKLAEDALKGTWDFEEFSGTFTATRVK